METVATNRLMFKSLIYLDSNSLLEAVGLGKEAIQEITTTDYYNYSIDEGKVYQCTHYEVRLR